MLLAARQALALDPEDRSSLYVMGMTALRERRFDEARDNALSILRRWPRNIASNRTGVSTSSQSWVSWGET